MAYEVIARKWRPQQFDDVVGQEHVTRTLKNAIEMDRVAHAYLFVGPRGIGKTTSARILAKALNCVNGPTTTPCDKCDSCLEITAGRSLDVLEIDGASNRGIDHIRELRDNVRYAPARGPFKIYIIDEVHMLTTESFNALLKTLEEPPPHVKFVFATTEPQKVPATILSRCQRFDLRPISAKAIIERLAEIAKAEKVEIDEDALIAIARAAEGGMRDAQSAMDQLIAFRGKNITEDDVMSVFGLMARKGLEDLAGRILSGDVAAALQTVADLDASGKDLQRVVVELLEHFRNVLVSLYGGAASIQESLTDVQVKVLNEQAAGTDAARVLRVIEILTEADQRLRFALSKRTLLEVALIRSARAATVASLDEILDQINRLKSGLGSADGASPPSKKSYPEPSASSGEVRAQVREAPAAQKSAPPPAETPARGDEVKVLLDRWHEVVDHAGQIAQLARGYLLDAKPLAVSETQVQIGFDPEFAEDKEKIDNVRCRKALQHALKSVLGRDFTVSFSVLEKKSTLPGDIKVESVTGESATKESALKSGARNMSMRARQEWAKNPVVQKTLEMFNGDIVDIRE